MLRTPLAWLNLVHDKARTAVALAGVAFAVVLILMQLGFLGSVTTTATMIYDRLKFDVLLVSTQYIDLRSAGTFPRRRLQQAAATEGVERVEPLNLGFSVWRNPETLKDRWILLLAPRDGAETFALAYDERPPYEALARPDQVLIDRRSRKEFGPQAAGVETEVGGQHMTIAGQFTLGTGFAADGAIMVGPEGFLRLLPYRRAETVNLGLIQVDERSSPEAVAARLRARLPDDVLVYTREAINERERHFWLTTTSVGTIFGLGAGIAVLVGVAIVYQVLSSDISNHKAEYATLKAMGYGPRYLSGIILQQAAILGVVGFVPGMLIAWGVYSLANVVANVPIGMTPARAVSVLIMSVVMCGVSGLAALRKVHAADPADLF
ncbi:MAG: ABC transporter permease DevC [Pirellulales bacterium]|nr:ABC transporter permease DevC [Pirellulales bacterium]